MSEATLLIDALSDAVHRLPANALAATRAAALANLRTHGLPTTRDEDWRYTDLGAAIDVSNRWLADGATSSPIECLDTLLEDITSSIEANWLVIANGQIDTARLPPAIGVEVEKFSDSTAPVIADRPLADFNAALLRDGLRLTVHAATEKPIAILIIDAATPQASVSQVNIEIDVMPGCDTEIIEFHTSDGTGDHYTNSVISMRVGESARMAYVRLQERQLEHLQTGRLQVAMERDSELDMASFDLGGGLIRNDVAIDLAASGANAICNGLYLANGNQHIDNHTRVDHSVGPATSSQEYRGILAGKSRCVWNGKAVVHAGADGTDAHQANHNLLLSELAEIDAKPELEIYADDVKCSHGTTVGQLDEAALFYLRTRGLDKDAARQLLMQSFAADLVRRSPISACREYISGRVEARLEDLLGDGRL